MHCPSALFLLQGIRRAALAQVTACRVVTDIGGKESEEEGLDKEDL